MNSCDETLDIRNETSNINKTLDINKTTDVHETQDIRVVSFYKFLSVDKTILTGLQTSILEMCQQNSILGTIILAKEGINGTVAGKIQAVQEIIIFIKNLLSLKQLEYKSASCDFIPFQKLKVLVKDEIVTFGVTGLVPHEKTGVHLTAKAWNQLISDPEVLVLDTRNAYEIEFGTFKGAINPNTESFGEFPDYAKQNLDSKKHKKIAMFCTGGIRCEKASSHLLEQGFEEVYQLEGGILKYLNEVNPVESLWEGHCFVFDERIAV